MTKSELAIKEASERASNYKYNMSNYVELPSGRTNSKKIITNPKNFAQDKVQD